MIERQIAKLIFLFLLVALSGCASTEPNANKSAPTTPQQTVRVTVCGTAECLELIADHCKNRFAKPSDPDISASVAIMVDQVSRLEAALPTVSGYDRNAIKYEFSCSEP